MADFIYLLENRLSSGQRDALGAVRQIAQSRGMTLFLVGGAVRDLISGSPVRDLDVVVQGNALKLKKDMELAGASISGSVEAMQALFVRWPSGVRMEVGSTLTASYPKPGKPVYKDATILDDLRRRDFTANAMALSLNEGSYGLLMDPLNGVADIENRELRLVSNYGFIEDPVRMIRATRFAARLGWELEEKTKARYETGKQEGYISALDEFHRGYEAEEIVHEEDPLRVMRRLEGEGWIQALAPGWTIAKANVVELEKVREAQTQLQMQGIHPDAAAINFPLLTQKLGQKEVQALKKSFPRQGFVAEIEAVEGEAKELASLLSGRTAAVPSAAYKLISSAKPEALLYVVYTTKSGSLQSKLKSFMTEWPQARQKIPYTLMQEMRITPEIEGYSELVEKIFFAMVDGKLETPEEMKAFLEPFSPPAPPPPIHVRRARTAKKDAKGKAKGKKGLASDRDEDDDLEASDLDGDEDELEDGPRGAEEDEEAEEAAEDFDAVAELGGAELPRKDLDDEEDDEEEEALAASRKPEVKKSSAVAKAIEPSASAAEEEAATGVVAEPATVEKKSVKSALVKGSGEVEASPKRAAAPVAEAEATKTGHGKATPPSVVSPLGGRGTKPLPGGERVVAVSAKVAAKAKTASAGAGSTTPVKVAKKMAVKVPAKKAR